MNLLHTLAWIFALCVYQGTDAQSCGTFEERTGTEKIQCAANVDFESLEWRVEIDGVLQMVYNCTNSGLCYHNPDYESKFHGTFESSNPGATILLSIDDIDRTMTRLRCYMNKAPTQGECFLNVYAKASEPSCEDPVFEEGNSIAVTTCTSQTVYPEGKCVFTVMGHDGSEIQNLDVASTNTDTGSNGDKSVQCQLRFPVTDSQAGVYQFDVSVIPDLDGVPDSAAVYVDTPPTLQLGPIALYKKDEGSHTFQYPENRQIATQIHVTGNPGPNRMLLSVRYDEIANFAPLSSNDFSATYTPTVGSEGGVISLTIVGGLDSTRKSYFQFTADNGVVGGSDFEYYFSVDADEDNGSDSNLPLILGAAVAGAAVVVLVVAVVICLMKRKKKQSQPTDTLDSGFISVVGGHQQAIRKGSLPPPYYVYETTNYEKDRDEDPAVEVTMKGDYMVPIQAPEYEELPDFDPPVDYSKN